LKLAISDRQLAILPVESDDAVEAALCIRPSGLMEALVRLFELLWESAVPVIVAEGEPESSTDQATDSEDRDLATLLASGAKDDVIARHLGVSPRTLSRRIADLLDDLHVRTRFQAGVRAAQLGWLSPDPDCPDDRLVQ
jgi:DNA-binding NarL/FixJ family response regulator